MGRESVWWAARTGGVVLAAAAAFAAQLTLQQTFATVRHPVSLLAANLTFDPDTVRGYYRVLDSQHTLDNMVRTEYVDYLWMVALAAFLFLVTRFVAALLATRHPAASGRLRTLAVVAPLVPVLDAVENAFSLVMLADPWGFPAWLAVAHAGVSWAKTLGIPVVAVGLPCYAIVMGVRGRPRE